VATATATTTKTKTIKLSKKIPVFQGQQSSIVYNQELIFRRKVVLRQEQEELTVVRRQFVDIPTVDTNQLLEHPGQVLVVIPHTLNAEAFGSESGPPKLDIASAPNPNVGHLQRSSEALAD